MEIKKCNNSEWNLYDKSNCVAHIRTSKQALNYGVILSKVHKVIQFNQETWLRTRHDSEPNCYTTKRFSENLLPLETIKVKKEK